MTGNKGIISQIAKMTPEERSEHARRAALIGAQKKREKARVDEFNFDISYDEPLPASRGIKNPRLHTFFDKIEVGGSFTVKDKGLFNRLYAFAGSYGRKSDKVFAGRTLKDGFGIWRVK